MANQESQKTKSPPEGVRSFVTVLSQLADGQCAVDLANAAHELQQELHKRACSKGVEGTAKGELKIKVKFLVDARGFCTLYYEYPETKAERPVRVQSTPFWLTDGKNLSAKPPKQETIAVVAAMDRERLEVRAVGAPALADDDSEDEDDDADEN